MLKEVFMAPSDLRAIHKEPIEISS